MLGAIDFENLTSQQWHYLVQKTPLWECYVMDPNQLERKNWVDERPFDASASTSRAPTRLGVLNHLTTEILWNLFSHLPLSDIWRLRGTGSHMRLSIQEWPLFHKLINLREGRILIQALLASGAARYFSIPALIEILHTTRCELCDEHGEFVYLLKLKRCCIRCLSNERELYVITGEEVRTRMGLTQTEPQQLPQLRTIRHTNFWGTTVTAGVTMVDFTSAVQMYYRQDTGRVSQALCQDRSESNPDRKTQVRHYVPLSETNRRLRPALFNNEKALKIHRERQGPRLWQRRPKVRLEACMTLPWWLINPLEGRHAQFTCTIHLPGSTKRHKPEPSLTKRSNNEPSSTTNRTQDLYYRPRGKQCAGCAYFWNYHSPCPRPYLTLYRHDPDAKSGPDTALKTHMQTCIYAAAWWQILYPAVGPPVELHRLIRIFDNNSRGRLHFRRHGHLPFAQSNFHFEIMPLRIRFFLHRHRNHAHKFTAWTKWPLTKPTPPTIAPQKFVRELTESEQQDIYDQLQLAHHDELVHDPYQDMWLGEQMTSQTQWACLSQMHSTAIFPFYFFDLGARCRRVHTKTEAEHGKGNVVMIPWGFDRL